jgi:hypothetical protein
VTKRRRKEKWLVAMKLRGAFGSLTLLPPPQIPEFCVMMCWNVLATNDETDGSELRADDQELLVEKEDA